MLFEECIASLIIGLSIYYFLRLALSQQWWTLILRFTCWLSSPQALVLVLLVAGRLSLQLFNVANDSSMSTGRLLCVILALNLLLFWMIILPMIESRRYLFLRWKAWTGPSRTGIPAHLTRYIGNEDDWKSMASSLSPPPPHPVEAWIRFIDPWSYGIIADPTALLASRLAADEEGETIWVPRSDVKSHTYAPVEPDQPVSLLWGPDVGFRARCSRGVISVPSRFLTSRPLLKNGLEAHSLNIAYAILSRNKGMQPNRLICNLSSADSIRMFEENSVLWPRPAKTLRSTFREEMKRSFSGLGESYIIAATELALLIADAGHELVLDWLNGSMEHQDLNLNNYAATHGASLDQLDRLYRGQYAALLVSLSHHCIGNRLRPEIVVFKALCRHEGVTTTPPWLSQDAMVMRGEQEMQMLGPRGVLSIQAVIG